MHANAEFQYHREIQKLKQMLIKACPTTNGGTIRRKLDFQTRVRILASTSIPIGNVGDEKKQQNHGRCFEWTIIEILVTGYDEGIMHSN